MVSLLDLRVVAAALSLLARCLWGHVLSYDDLLVVTHVGWTVFFCMADWQFARRAWREQRYLGALLLWTHVAMQALDYALLVWMYAWHVPRMVHMWEAGHVLTSG